MNPLRFLPTAAALVWLAAGALAQPTTSTAPARPISPPVDHVKDLFDLYSQGRERSRFFDAAGVDGELTEKEFLAAAKKPKSFARPYDRWDLVAIYDKTRPGKLNWSEAEQYRLAVRKRVLAMFDRSKDRKLTGKERVEANRYLTGGIKVSDLIGIPLQLALLGDEQEGAWPDLREQDAPPAPEAWRRQRDQLRQKNDADGDGEHSAEQRAATLAEANKQAEQRRQRWIARYDADGDGKLSDQERRTMQEAGRRQAQERTRQRDFQRYDADKNGKLDEAERAAMERVQAERQERWQQARQQRQRRRQGMDADGDGNVTRQEMGAYWRKIRDKYDADGDGQLNEAERRELMDKEGFGRARAGRRGRRGGRRPSPRQQGDRPPAR